MPGPDDQPIRIDPVPTAEETRMHIEGLMAFGKRNAKKHGDGKNNGKSERILFTRISIDANVDSATHKKDGPNDGKYGGSGGQAASTAT